MTHISYAASLALSAAILAALTLPAEAATEKVLWSFKNDNLGHPEGRLLLHYGSLFGTGAGDGSNSGQVFKLTQSGGVWKESALLKFDGADGGAASAGLIYRNGTFYGTTYEGDVYGKGNVFYLSKSGGVWLHGTIWAFGNGSDGSNPACDLVADGSGNLYGTTFYGGTSGNGIVFELSFNGIDWSESVLYNFTGGSDGATPYAGLVMDKTGALYGTAANGGPGLSDTGTVFQLTQSGGVWTEKTLYNFTGGSDGANPFGGLVIGSGGNLFGTTEAGGTPGCYLGVGCGTVFELTQSGGVWTEKTLYGFTGGNDGANPGAALRWNGSGGLYGTAAFGGTPGCSFSVGCGTVFELTQSGGVWSETVLHAFGAGSDGQNPSGAVIIDASGNLYGTTGFGGAYGGTNGYGTVWEITP